MRDESKPIGKYDKAFSLYCGASGEPDLCAIAQECNCNSEVLVEFAARRNWAQKRGLVLAQSATLATQNRVETAARVDSEAVKEYAEFFARMTSRLHVLTDVVCALPLNDPDPRIRAQQAAKGLELVNETIKGMAGLVETAKGIGLVLGPKTGSQADAGRIDFSRLTTLSLTLIQAQKEAGQQPIQVMDLDAESVR